MGSDWRDKEVGRSGISLAELADGQELVCEVVDNPSWQEHEFENEAGEEDSSEAFHVPVIPSEYPDGFTDMSGSELQDQEYDIINSSSGFYSQFRDLFPNSSPVGSVIVITAHQSGDEFSRYYEVTETQID